MKSLADLPRATGNAAPDVFSSAGSVPMRQYRDHDPVDFAIVGTGAGGGTLAAYLAEAGFSVVAFDAGPFFRPLADFASDERAQDDLYWNEERLSGGANPITFGSNNSGRCVGGSTVHYQMVSLRFRPDWFRSRSRLGYGHDWPVDPEDMARHYAAIEEDLKIAGPVHYPWDPKRGRYPYRPHEVNAAGLLLAEAAETTGHRWAPAPLATLSAPRKKASPCVYRGFCKVGCSTNAKQSVLVTYIPRALAAGAEIRDMARVIRVESDTSGNACGLHYRRNGKEHFQRARAIVVAGYAIETARLLLHSSNGRQPHGLGNHTGTLGQSLMVHSNDAVFAELDREVRWYKGPPSMALTEDWNYIDEAPDKDFMGGYALMSQGPLPVDFAKALVSNTGLFGMALRSRMAAYNRIFGIKMVGEVEPRAENSVTLADEKDAFGVPKASVTFGYSANDQRLIRHARNKMAALVDAVGGQNAFTTSDTAHLLGGCPIGSDHATSLLDPYGRSWSVPNLWVMDGSVFPTSGGVNPSLTIMALARRTAERIARTRGRGDRGANP